MPVSSKDTEQKKEEQSVQLLVFSLAEEEYALGLTEIQEIVAVPDITPVPNMPDAVKGIANLRGRVVTIVDLETLFETKQKDAKTKEHIIVAEKEDELFGLLVDTAQEVLRTTPDSVRETPDLLQAHPHADFLKGVIVLNKTVDKGQRTTKKPKTKNQKPKTNNEQTSNEDRIIMTLDLQKILSGFPAAKAEPAAPSTPSNS